MFRYGNEVPKPDIPIISMFFSFISIVLSTVKMNIFNVFIVQIRSTEDSSRYARMIYEYLPMFLHSILYRVAAYSFFYVFLFSYSFIPFFAIFFSNVVISYLNSGSTALEDNLKTKLNTYVHHHQKSGLAKAHQSFGDSPVWLNILLGIFSPTCFLTGPPPDFIDLLTTEEYNEVLKQLAKHQKKILRIQIIATTFIIMITTGVIFYLIQFTEWKYTPNILSFWDFNVYCGLIVVQSIISIIFVIEVDKLKKLCSTNTQRFQLFKFLNCGICCLFLLSLPLSACFLSNYTSHSHVYILSKSQNTTNLEMVKGKLINKDLFEFSIQHSSTKCSVLNDTGNFNEKILILDQDCMNKNIPNLSNKEQIENKFKGAAAILFLSNKIYENTHRPWKYEIFRSVAEFPIILVDYFDSEKIKDMSGDDIELYAGDISKFLLNDTSSIYRKKCDIWGDESKVINSKERKGYYFGCNGNIKKNINSIKCQEKGHECPEIEHFENILLKRDPFRACNNIENRPTDEDHFKNNVLPNIICTDEQVKIEQIFSAKTKFYVVSKLLIRNYIIFKVIDFKGSKSNLQYGFVTDYYPLE